MVISMFRFLLRLHLTASIITRVSSILSTTWETNMHASKDIYLAFGEKHSRLHFPSSLHLSKALLHQLDIVSRGRELTIVEEGKNVEHPFMSCASYLEYDAVILNLAQRIGANFQSHISYTSASDDRICFTVFVKNKDSLRTFTRSLKTKELFLFVPVPDILKVDHSLLHAIDWMSEQALNVHKNTSRNLRSQSIEALSKHPILDDISKGLPTELSIIFRPSWSSISQEKSSLNWFENLLQNDRENSRTLLERTKHWENFIWTRKKTFDESSGMRTQNSDSKSYHHLEDDEDFSHIYKQIKNLPPHFDNGNKRIISENIPANSNQERNSPMTDKWEILYQNFLNLESNEYLNKKNSIKEISNEKCDYSNITIVHRKNNILLKLNSNFLQLTKNSASCLANIIILISSDKGVSRIALSRPIRTLNNVARPIMQNGNVKDEPYSIAGLDGTGVVVGISDTGIDENSCYFKDPKGKILRSSPEFPHIDHNYRKVILYVNFSGSGGDTRAGHGSHVAGTVAGYSLGSGNQYKGMASGAKLAFFDIGATNQDLIVPSDLSTYLFPSAYLAGARLHSNSWGGGYWYDAYCIEVDDYLYNNDDFLTFFAGGNNGGDGYNTILSPGLSKNSIAVAASYTTSIHMSDIAFFSSIGPAPDGRNKPDITAPGYYISSANAEVEGSNKESCNVVMKAGTSMATPVSAGTAALLIQYFQDKNFWLSYCNPSYYLCLNGTFTPKGPTIKALLIHSGVGMSTYQGMGNTVGRVILKSRPDIFQGFGRVNLINILPLIHYTKNSYTLYIDQSVLTPLSEYRYIVFVRSTLQPLRATISWFDPPNTEFAAKVLLHDLDLILISPSGVTYNGNSQIMNKDIRDELNNNEQIIVSLDGLVTGNWTLRVQAKMLPYVPYQAFSLVITVDGVVIPPVHGSSPVPIDPKILQKCQVNDKSSSQLSIDVSLWQMDSSTGWSSDDKLRISSGVVEQNKNGTIILSEKSILKEIGFNKKLMYGIENICLPKGCYEASFLLNQYAAKQSSCASIPMCGVFVAPLNLKQIFCIDESIVINGSNYSNNNNNNNTNYNNTNYNTTSSTTANTNNNKIFLFKEKSCFPLCNRQTNVNFNIIIAEGQGAGWMGAYYVITPLVPKLIQDELISENDIVEMNLANINGVSSGTLEWDFEQERSICIPIKDYFIPSTHRSNVINDIDNHNNNNNYNDNDYNKNDYNDNNSKNKNHKNDNENFDNKNISQQRLLQQQEQQEQAMAPTCFSIQLSIPVNEALPVFPLLAFKDAWSVPEGSNYYEDLNRTKQCDIMMNVNNTYGIMCVDPVRALGSITFYTRLSSSVGQVPITREAELIAAYSLKDKTEIGSCAYTINYQEGISPFNFSNHHTQKTESFTSIPTTSPTTLNHPLSPGKYQNFSTDNDFECLKSCPHYPGKKSFYPVGSNACDFFMTDVYNLCSSYSIAHGSCPRLQCTLQCKIKDYCFFGVNSATYCPFNTWGEGDNTSVNGMIQTCIDSTSSHITNSGSINSTIESPRSTLVIIAFAAGAIIGLLISICFFMKCFFYSDRMNTSSGSPYSSSSLLNRMRPTKVSTLEEFSFHSSDIDFNNIANTNSNGNSNSDINSNNISIRNSTTNIDVDDSTSVRNVIHTILKTNIAEIVNVTEIKKDDDKNENKSNNNENEGEEKEGKIGTENEKITNDLEEIQFNSSIFVTDEIPEKKNKEIRRKASI